jgi:lipoate-protein ligase A
MVFASFDLDDDLIEATKSDGLPRLRVYRFPSRAVVLGRGSQAEAEVDLAATAEDHVPVLRRRGGGCAVVLDPGNVVVSLAVPMQGLGQNLAAFAAISRWLIDALAANGVHGVSQRGVSDLTIGEFKIGGACIYRSKDLLFYTTTLLVRPELARVARYLLHPPREPDYRHGRPHSSFMGSLCLAGIDDIERFATTLGSHLRARSPFEGMPAPLLCQPLFVEPACRLRVVEAPCPCIAAAQATPTVLPVQPKRAASEGQTARRLGPVH